MRWLWFLVLTVATPCLSLADYMESERMPLAHRAPVLDITAAGDRYVAVGERGHVLISYDQGRNWQQVVTPTRTTLTAVHFADADHGWAVGHRNTVLRTRDGGYHWERLHLPATEFDSYLDVRFVTPESGMVVGAYGMYLRTRDGGESWEKFDVSPEELHFNHLHRGPAGQLYLVMEMGGLLTADGMDSAWHALPSPYEGSLFGMQALDEDGMLVHGLRGHLFYSSDRGSGWRQVDLDTTELLMASAQLPDGRVIVAGQRETYYLSDPEFRSFSPWRQNVVEGTAVLLSTDDAAVLAGGLNGVYRLIPPEMD